MVVHAHQPVDFFGTQRKKVLKEAFRVIIDYIVPIHVKTFKVGFNQGSHIKLLDQYEKIKQSNKQHKFCKNKEDSVFDIFSKYKFSDSVIKSWKADSGLQEGLSELEKLVHDLLKVRNSIFKTLNSMNDYFTNSGVYLGYTKQDLVEYAKFVSHVKTRQELDPVNLWNLPSKKPQSDVYEDCCLSE